MAVHHLEFECSTQANLIPLLINYSSQSYNFEEFLLVVLQDLEYKVGDVLEVLPSQDPNAVEAFIRRTNLDPDSYITVITCFQ